MSSCSPWLGIFLVKLDGVITKLSAGDDAVTIPIGAPPTFVRSTIEKTSNEENDEALDETNETDDDNGIDVEVEITLRPNPGNQMQRFFPNLFGTIRDGGPNLVQILYIFCTNGVRLADIPKPIHEVVCLTTRGVAPLLGYRHEYEEYVWKE